VETLETAVLAAYTRKQERKPANRFPNLPIYMELESTPATLLANGDQLLSRKVPLSFPAIHKFFHRSLMLLRTIIHDINGEEES
jgi:hypothetical protein